MGLRVGHTRNSEEGGTDAGFGKDALREDGRFHLASPEWFAAVVCVA